MFQRSQRRAQPSESEVGRDWSAGEAEALGGNGFAAAQLPAVVEEPSLLGSLVANAEASFGMTLGAEVVGGEEGAEVAGREGAFATTIGSTVYLGEEVADLGPDEQAFVVTHELAHIAQQHGDGGEGDAEADADQLAHAALAGESATPGVAASVSEAHDLSLDDIQRAGADFVEGAADLVEAGADLLAEGLETVVGGFASAADLLAWLCTVDEGTARKAIDMAAASRSELVEGLVILAPAHALAAYALSVLSESGVLKIVQQLDASSLALLLVAAPAALVPVCPVIGIPALAAALLLIPAEQRLELLDSLAEVVVGAVAFLLDNRVTPDTGFAFACEVGVTFGVPVKAGTGGSFTLINRGNGVIEYEVKGEAQLGVDTGVGGGGSIGAGGGGTAEGEVGLGLGAEAGAESGGRGIVEAKYEADLFALQLPSQLLDLLADVADGTGVASGITNLLLGFGMYGFHRSTTIRAEVFVEGEGKAKAGLSTGEAGTLPSFSSDQEGAGSGKVASWWQAFMQASGALKISGDSGLTVGIDTPEWVENEAGVLEPSQASLTLEGSSEALVELTTKSPLPIPEIPDVGAGLGVKAIFPIVRAGETFSFLDPDWSLSASAKLEDAEFQVDIGQSQLEGTTYEEVLGILTGAKFEWRIGAGAPAVGPVVDTIVNRFGLANKVGVSITGEVTHKAKMPKERLQAVVEKVLGPPTDEHRYEVLGQALLRFVQGDASGLLAGFDELVQGIHDGHEETKVRVEVGYELGGEAKVGAGAKVAVEGSIEAGTVIDTEVAGPDEAEVAAILDGEGLAGGDKVELN